MVVVKAYLSFFRAVFDAQHVNKSRSVMKKAGRFFRGEQAIEPGTGILPAASRFEDDFLKRPGESPFL
jgi:hypothetical protein